MASDAPETAEEQPAEEQPAEESPSANNDQTTNDQTTDGAQSPTQAPARNGHSDGGLPDDDVRELLEVLQDVRRGDFTARMAAGEGRSAQVAQTLNDIIEQNESLVNEMRRARTVVGEKGELEQRVSLPGLTGDWVEAMDAVNDLVMDLGDPISEMRRVIGAVGRGDLSQKMELETDGRPLRGELLRTAKTINAMVDQLSDFSAES
jgi:HAMP domain-containing protein